MTCDCVLNCFVSIENILNPQKDLQMRLPKGDPLGNRRRKGLSLDRFRTYCIGTSLANVTLIVTGFETGR